MNIVDIIIIVSIVLGVLIGFVRGFFKETVIFIGTILVVVLAFVLKNPLSLILYKNLPFFKFKGIFEGISTLNILIYEILAFIIALAILSIALTIIIKISGIIEKILKLTIVLALPSKLLGAIVGFIQSIVVLYVFLFLLSLPILRVPYIKNSKYAQMILEKTPVISKVTDGLVKTFNEISDFADKNIKNNVDKRQTNREMLEIMLKNDVVTSENVKYLSDKGKIDIDNIDELLSKYKED
ncbi:MAG: CvpA family protein [Bacilli bacterium]